MSVIDGAEYGTKFGVAEEEQRINRRAKEKRLVDRHDDDRPSTTNIGLSRVSSLHQTQRSSVVLSGIPPTSYVTTVPGAKTVRGNNSQQRKTKFLTRDATIAEHQSERGYTLSSTYIFDCSRYLAATIDAVSCC